MKRFLFFVALVLLGSCCVAVATSVDGKIEVPEDEELETEKPTTAPAPTPKPKKKQEEISPAKADPYANWAAWCERDERKSCDRHSDCGPENGLEMRCITPYYAPDDGRVCVPKFPTRPQRDAVAGEVDSVARTLGASANARRLLALVGLRESSWRPYKRHRLSPDEISASKAYRRLAGRYKKNPHFRDPDRWDGLGLFGQNSPLWVMEWDTQAPPEILCRPPAAVYTYLRRGRRVAQKLTAGVMCDGAKYHGSGKKPLPTWYDVHRGVSSGSVCPRNHARAATRRSYFTKRARRVNLDPDAYVRPEEFGKELPSLDERNAWLYATTTMLDLHG